jgi:hypothetical protein
MMRTGAWGSHHHPIFLVAPRVHPDAARSATERGGTHTSHGRFRAANLLRSVYVRCWAGESTCKPDSVSPVTRGGGHPSRPGVAAGLVRPTRRLGRAALERLRGGPGPAFLGLAPGGVYLAAPVTRGAGGLLHHRFTLTWPHRPGGLFSVALSRGSPRVAVNNHPALRSPDFPRRLAPPRPPGRLARPTRIARSPDSAETDGRAVITTTACPASRLAERCPRAGTAPDQPRWETSLTRRTVALPSG